LSKSEGALWQGTQTHIESTIKAKTPLPLPLTTKEPSKKFFYSLEFVSIKSRRRYGWISYEESVGEEDRRAWGDRVRYCPHKPRNDYRTLGRVHRVF